MTPRSQPPSWYTKTDRSARRSYGGWHGLLPAALSHAVGAETQRPFAVVIIGGLVTATLLTLFILPVLYELFEREEEEY